MNARLVAEADRIAMGPEDLPAAAHARADDEGAKLQLSLMGVRMVCESVYLRYGVMYHLKHNVSARYLDALRRSRPLSYL